MGQLVGYQVYTKRGFEGEPGDVYTYELGADGLYVEGVKRVKYDAGDISYLIGRVQVAEVKVRGLDTLPSYLTFGDFAPPSAPLWDAMVQIARKTPEKEGYWAIQKLSEDRVEGWALSQPRQNAGSASVTYEPLKHVAVDIHSHGKMPPFFSGTDNRDDQGFRVSIVIGCLDKPVPQVRCRLGIYGYFGEVKWEQVFEGKPAEPFDQVSENDAPAVAYHRRRRVLFAGMRLPLLGVEEDDEK